MDGKCGEGGGGGGGGRGGGLIPAFGWCCYLLRGSIYIYALSVAKSEDRELSMWLAGNAWVLNRLFTLRGLGQMFSRSKQLLFTPLAGLDGLKQMLRGNAIPDLGHFM